MKYFVLFLPQLLFLRFRSGVVISVEEKSVLFTYFILSINPCLSINKHPGFTPKDDKENNVFPTDI